MGKNLHLGMMDAIFIFASADSRDKQRVGERKVDEKARASSSSLFKAYDSRRDIVVAFENQLGER